MEGRDATAGFHAVVLAAGAGRRFGGGKLVAPWRGAPLIHAALAAACAAPVETVTVVVGADRERVANAVLSFPASRPLRVVVARNWEDGMSASLKAGVEAVPAQAAGVFVFLGDMPLIPSAVLAPLADAITAGAAAAAPRHLGRRGHPVVLGPALLGRVSKLAGDTGARSLFSGVVVGEVETGDGGVVFDVDTAANLEHL